MDAKEEDRLGRFCDPETAAAYDRRDDDNMGLLVPSPNMWDEAENDPGSPIVIDVDNMDGEAIPLRPDVLRL
jgi:hypothetical protein